jgi:hypothetical protein
MTRQAVSLDVIDIARPCPADWDDMRGDAQVRFCKHCSLNVYNLSAMTRAQAERLVTETEGRLCVRMYRRLDGTVVTADCEGAIKLAARRFGRFARTATAVVLTAALAPLGFSRWLNASPTEKSSDPAVCVKPPEQPAKQGEAIAIMGDMVAPAPQPQPHPVQFLGRMANPRNHVMLGKMAAQPLMGSPAPLPAPVPATQPATTQPSAEMK